MRFNVGKEVTAMKRLTMKELRARYADVFGEQTNANNRVWLIRRIAWRLQAKAEGDLSERARPRATELANDADLRLSPPKAPADPAPPERTVAHVLQFKSDRRLPPPGSIITRPYKGEDLDGKDFAGCF